MKTFEPDGLNQIDYVPAASDAELDFYRHGIKRDRERRCNREVDALVRQTVASKDDDIGTLGLIS